MRWARILLAALPFALLALAYPALRELPRIAGLENNTLTWRYTLRGPEPPSAPVTIVAIDDATVAAAGGWPLPRDQLGTAIRRLSEVGAAVIAVDLLMAEPARPRAADADLAAALRASGRTLLPVAGTANAAQTLPRPVDLSPHTVPMNRGATAPAPPQPPTLLTPITLLAQTAGLGHVNVGLGSDGTLTSLPPAILLPDGSALPSLAVLAVARLQGAGRSDIVIDLSRAVHIGNLRVPLGTGGQWTPAFYGPAGSFKTIPLIDVLRGAFNIADVRGRIVWLGATATSSGDTFVTPFDPAMPGVEAFATLSANLLDNTFLSHGPWTMLVEMAAVILLGTLGWHAGHLHPARWAILAAFLPVAAWIALAVAVFLLWQIWLNITVPAVASVLGTGTAVAIRLILGDAQRRRLARYVPKPLAEALANADRPAFEGQVLSAAVLFVDMIGFTNRSETASPSDTVAMMRALHTELEDGAHRHGGYVDNFAGDGAMLVFGVPTPRPDDAARALACARDLLVRTARTDLPVRIGLHHGLVQVARLGGRQQHQLTLAGDTVNLASRLMAIAKERGVGLVVSTSVVDQIPVQSTAALDGMMREADLPVRGRQAPVDVWLGPFVERHAGAPIEAAESGNGQSRS
ncbi:CHASE2 domain-containing protein [Rhodovibrio salinarum]|uniref:CHASE2 domain-containing protein n=1 Tax=Rhodovibrio salinarum TaxID=1087 RepID=UPI0004843063|nr:adenylate/guanylate cyclase domain-containing protein [Rhodovibrio salinarum]